MGFDYKKHENLIIDVSALIFFFLKNFNKDTYRQLGGFLGQFLLCRTSCKNMIEPF